MGVFDSYVTVGEELVDYGTTAASLTRGYDALEDPARIIQSKMQTSGLRAGRQGATVSQTVTQFLGGEGTFPVTILSKSMGLLFKAALSDSTAITGPPAGFGFESGSSSPGTSLTVQVHRGHVNAATGGNFTYRGGKVKTWEITQTVGNEDSLAKLSLGMFYRDVTTAVAAATAAYPTDPHAYNWNDCAITVDGNSGCEWDLSITGDNGLKTDRFCLSGSGLTDEPYRTTLPTYGGSFTTDYDDDTLYDLFISGEAVPIVVTWTHDADESLTITMPACRFTGDTPVASPGSSTLSASWEVLWNEVDPMISVEYITPDVAP